jgi:hypothetical protein
VKAATLHRSDFVQQNAANTKTNTLFTKEKINLNTSINLFYNILHVLNEKWVFKKYVKCMHVRTWLLSVVIHLTPRC